MPDFFCPLYSSPGKIKKKRVKVSIENNIFIERITFKQIKEQISRLEMELLSNTAIFEKLISSDSTDNEEAMTYLYTSLYGKVKGYILKNKGQKEEVKDVFQDAMLAFFKLVKQNKVTKETKIEAYIFSICRNLWLKQLQKKKRESSDVVEELDIPIDDVLSQSIFSIDKSSLLNTVLKEIGKGCETILLAFYYERQSMEEITQSMDLSSVQIAKNKKYKCLQRLKALILNSDYYKDNLR